MRPFRGRPDRTQEKRSRVNQEIRVAQVRVIDPDGNQLGVMPTEKAIDIAVSQFSLDLVEISPNATPPVCKILDYGKHKYEMKKKAQEAKRNQVSSQLKEVKFRPKTDVHDFDFKVKHVRRFLEGGNKAKVTIFFRGREIIYADQGKTLLQKVYSVVEDIAQIESEPKMEGRYMSMILAPRSSKGKVKDAENKDK